MDIKNRSLILDFWEGAFNILSYISIFKIIRLVKGEISYRFVELWVVYNVILSFATTLILFHVRTSNYWIYYLFLSYGVLRIFEIIVYQINVLIFDPYRALKAGQRYRIKSPTRLVVLLFHNYFEIICWFTAVLIAFLSMSNNLDNTWGEYLKLNFFYITTFNTEGITTAYTKIHGGAIWVMYESIVGYIITLVTMVRFIGLLPAAEFIDDL